MKASTRITLFSSLICLALAGCDLTAAPVHATASQISETVAKPTKLSYRAAEVSHQVRKADVPANSFPLRPEKAMSYLANADKLLRIETTKMGTILLYSKTNDRENFYAAFLTPKALYELGETGTKTSLNLAGIKLDTIWGANVPLLRIKGVFGANVKETNYFYLVDQEVRPLLVASGNIIETDFDKDKLMELVSTAGTPQVTTLYRYRNGRVEEANLNQQLGAISIQPRKSGADVVFDVLFQGQTKPVTFRLADDTLQPITS